MLFLCILNVNIFFEAGRLCLKNYVQKYDTPVFNVVLKEKIFLQPIKKKTISL